jgi:hypothetical protein
MILLSNFAQIKAIISFQIFRPRVRLGVDKLKWLDSMPDVRVLIVLHALGAKPYRIVMFRREQCLCLVYASSTVDLFLKSFLPMKSSSDQTKFPYWT